MDFEFDLRRLDSPLSEWRNLPSSLLLFDDRLEVSLLEPRNLRRFSLLSLVDDRRNESLLLLLVDDRLNSPLPLMEDRTLRFKAFWSFFAKLSSRDALVMLWLNSRDPFFLVADFLSSGAD